MAEVVIIGAGITGLTTALLLERAGYDVAIIDAHPVGFGVTGFNSGHLTTLLLDLKFRHIIPAFGEEATRIITRACEEAIDQIEHLVNDYRIDCNFRRLPGYLFAEKTSQLRDLQQEANAIDKAGLQTNRTYHVPLPFPVEEGIHITDQAVIDPLKYTQRLAQKLSEHAVQIYENSRVTDIENPSQGHFIVKTEAGFIECKELVIATHTPIGFRPLSQTRLEPLRSYVIGFRSDSPLPDALFWDMDEPYHYIRLAEDERGPLILVGGEDHKTGNTVNTAQCFQNLENYARARFNVLSVDYRWSAQLYNPADGLPYIGKTADAYIATGYSGEGLTFGTVAARLITDQIQGIANPCIEILNPNRAKPLASAGGFIADSINAVGHFVGDRLKKPQIENPQDVPLGEGAICMMDGNKVAAYHSPDGVLHLMSPVCTHMNCLVAWNAAEKSWDCPCHGGRFTATGQVLNGPPVDDLEPVDLVQE